MIPGLSYVKLAGVAVLLLAIAGAFLLGERRPIDLGPVARQISAPSGSPAPSRSD